MLMLHSPLVMRPGFSMGLGSWRMETFQDHAEKSTQEHGKDGGPSGNLTRSQGGVL